jgi:hypothetical protein
MSRGVQSFTQGDVTKAVKGVVKAGVKAGRVEFVPGKITVFFGEPEPVGEPVATAAPDADDLDRELAAFEARRDGED